VYIGIFFSLAYGWDDVQISAGVAEGSRRSGIPQL
jgi:hypothetical protein